MKILNLIQGTDAWKEARRTHHCASDAPAMMGEGKHESRSALIRRIATGVSPEIDAATQRRFDAGHKAEAEARSLVEGVIGEDLYPVTAVDDDDYLLASLDGLTMDEKTIFEHKIWNADVIAMIERAELSPAYFWQLEHQLATTGADAVVFCCSDGTAQNLKHMTYTAQPGRREALMRGWQMLDEEVANYVPEAVPEKLTPKARPTLPAVFIRVDGALAVSSNLEALPGLLDAYIKQLPINPSTDQEFIDAEDAIKTLKEIEEALAAQESAALASLAEVNQMRQLVAKCDAKCSTARIAMFNKVKARKEEIRGEILAEGLAEIKAHIRAINERLGSPILPVVIPDFVGAMKGKKSVVTLREAMKGALVEAKIAASAKGDLIDANLKLIRALPEAHQALCADDAMLVQKPTADVQAIIAGRVAAQKARDDALAEKVRQDEAERIAKEAAAAAQVNPSPAIQELVVAASDVFSLPTPAETKPDNGARIKVGDISERLGLTITADFLLYLGFEAEVVKRAHLYREADFGSICFKLIQHVRSVMDQHGV